MQCTERTFWGMVISFKQRFFIFKQLWRSHSLSTCFHFLAHKIGKTSFLQNNFALYQWCTTRAEIRANLQCIINMGVLQIVDVLQKEDTSIITLCAELQRRSGKLLYSNMLFQLKNQLFLLKNKTSITTIIGEPGNLNSPHLWRQPEKHTKWEICLKVSVS